MEANNMGGYLDESHPKPTRDQFIKNYKSLKEEEDLLSRAKMIKDSSAMAHHSNNITNLKGILIRQITTGIWKEPKESYLKAINQKHSV